MAIKINFDAAHNPEEPTFVLAKKSGDKIGKINAHDVEVVDSLNDAAEISFTVYKYVDGKQDVLWDDIANFKLVYCVEWNKWFEITVELDESTETIKTVAGICLGQAELSQIMLYNIQINTEDDIARDDYVVPTVLYDDLNHDSSLLHRIMEKAPHYSVIHVDNTIASIQRTFEFDGTSIYDAFQDIAEEINCLFVFNSDSDSEGNIQRTISVYDLESNCLSCGHRGEFTMTCPKCGGTDINEGYGEDTSIFVTSDELAENISLSTDTDAVKNCFKLEAGDDLMTATIRNCNPNGTDYLWYFSDDMKSDMPEELVESIESYDKEIEKYQTLKIDIDAGIVDKYNKLVEKYIDYNDKLEFIPVDSDNNPNIIGYSGLMNAYYNTVDLELYLESSMMPNVKMSDTNAKLEVAKLTAKNLSPVSTTSIEYLSGATADNIVLSAARVVADSRYRVTIAESAFEIQEDKRVWTGKFAVVNYSDEEDKATSESVSIVIDGNYENFIRQKIEKTLSKGDDEDLSISGLFKKSLKNSDVVKEMEKAKTWFSGITDDQVKRLGYEKIQTADSFFQAIEDGSISSVFGNIDMDKREVVIWTDENKAKYADAMKSWDEDGGTWYSTVGSGSYDTVHGGSSRAGNSLDGKGVEVAWSPMVVDTNGKLTNILSKDYLLSYIEETVKQAYEKDKAFNQSTILSLDTLRIIGGTDTSSDYGNNGLGNTAVIISMLMHFVGKYGAIQQAPNFSDKSEFACSLEEYSLNRLKSFHDSCQACIDVLVAQGIADRETWADYRVCNDCGGYDCKTSICPKCDYVGAFVTSCPNCNYKGASINKCGSCNKTNIDYSEDMYTKIYIPYVQRLQEISKEMKIREDEIAIISGVYNSDKELVTYGIQNYIEDKKNDIQKKLDFESYIGKELWMQFCAFRREDKYSNDNYVSDGFNSAEIFSKALEFIQVAQNEIYKSAELQHSISSSLKNLLVIDKFLPLVNDFMVGNWLRIMIDDRLYKLRLIEYSIDYNNIDGISVEFSDAVRVKDSISDVKSVISQASNMATSYSTVKRQAQQGSKSDSILSNWTSSGLDTTNMKIIGGSGNQVQTWDDHGMLFREYNSVFDNYNSTQLKIINSTIAITDDNWQSVKTAIGKFNYVDPKTNELKDAYGVNGETIVGKLIIGQGLGIYNKSGSMTFDDSGFIVTNTADTNKITIDPNGSSIFNIQNRDGNNEYKNVLSFDDEGNLVIVGNIVAQDLQLISGVTIDSGRIKGLSAVAVSGKYKDLIDKPELFDIPSNNATATAGQYLTKQANGTEWKSAETTIKSNGSSPVSGKAVYDFAVARNHGSNNAGKFLYTDKDGNVTLVNIDTMKTLLGINNNNKG